MPASRKNATPGTVPPGPGDAIAPLVPLVYDELRRIARRHLGAERPDHTLSTTALVHEAWMKLADQTHGRWRERSHFCAIASRAMRRILVDHARRHSAQKRGGARRRIPLGDVALTIDERAARQAFGAFRSPRLPEPGQAARGAARIFRGTACQACRLPRVALRRTMAQPEITELLAQLRAQLARARATDRRRLERMLRGDLDAIVMKALRKEPEHRYATVEALLADLDRQRAGVPVARLDVHPAAGCGSHARQEVAQCTESFAARRSSR